MRLLPLPHEEPDGVARQLSRLLVEGRSAAERRQVAGEQCGCGLLTRGTAEPRPARRLGPQFIDKVREPRDEELPGGVLSNRVHVVFHYSGAGSLRAALPLWGLNERVIGLDGDYSIGPIDCQRRVARPSPGVDECRVVRTRASL